jgi:hypothetical protein
VGLVRDQALVDELAQRADRGRAVGLAAGQLHRPEHFQEFDFRRGPPVVVALVDLVLRRDLRGVGPILEHLGVDRAVDDAVRRLLHAPGQTVIDALHRYIGVAHIKFPVSG